MLSRRNQSPDAVRSKNPSKSTLAHDAVAAAVSHKHHSIICIGAVLIQYVYGSHSKLGQGAHPIKNSILAIFRASFEKSKNSSKKTPNESNDKNYWYNILDTFYIVIQHEPTID